MMEPDPPRYGLLEALYKSFYSRSFYVDVARRWHSRAIKLGILLCLLLAVDLTSRTYIDFVRNPIKDAQVLSKALPELVVADGQLQLATPEPVVFKDEQGKSLLVIDTSGRLQSNKESGSKYLLTRDRLLVQDSNDPDESTSHALNLFATDWAMKPESLPGFITMICNVCAAVIFVAVISVMPLILLVNAAVIGYGLKLFKSKRPVPESMRLAIASVCPAVVAGLLIDPFAAAFGVPAIIPDTIGRFVGFGYLIFAFRATAPIYEVAAEQPLTANT